MSNKPVIAPASTDSCCAEAKKTLEEITRELGTAPNYVRTAARSPSVLRSLWEQLKSARQSTLSERLQHAVALRVAELNACPYSLASTMHSFKESGLSEQESIQYRRGMSDDRLEQSVLALVTKVVRDRGCNAALVVDNARSAGLSDQAILEVIQLVALNTFINYLNNIAITELDFPEVGSLPERGAGSKDL